MLQVQLFIGKEKMKDQQPLYRFVLNFLMDNEINGATAFYGFAGYGYDKKLHLPDRQFSFDDTPVMITFIDEQTKVERILPQLKEIIKHGLILSHPVKKW